MLVIGTQPLRAAECLQIAIDEFIRPLQSGHRGQCEIIWLDDWLTIDVIERRRDERSIAPGHSLVRQHPRDFWPAPCLARDSVDSMRERSRVRASTKPTMNSLKPDPRNANRGTDRGRAALAHSLREFGPGRAVLLDRHGTIIAGNKTVEQATRLAFAMRNR